MILMIVKMVISLSPERIDTLSKIFELIKEHPYKFFAVLIVLALFLWAASCSPKVKSVIDPPRMVNKFELQAELDLIIVQFENKFESIAQQEEFVTALFDAAAQMYTTGTIDPVGVGLTFLGILGLGAGADDVRLRRRIKHNGGTAPPV